MANKKLVIDFALLNNCCSDLKNRIGALEEHINYLSSNGEFPTYNKAIAEHIKNLKAFKTTMENINDYLSRKANDYKSLDGLK